MSQPTASGDYVDYRSGGWRGKVLGDWQQRVGGGDLAWYLQHPHELIHSRPGGRTWRVTIAGLTVYVKHVSASYRTDEEGGWRLIKRLRWAVRSSPALRLARVTRVMQQRGIAVPRVLQALYAGSGPGRQELTVTESVEGWHAIQIAAYDPQGLPGALTVMARKVRELHDAGVLHGHLLAGHMLMTLDRRDVYFIDNDENRIYRNPVPWPDRMRNLVQIAHQVGPIYGAWRPFFHAYFEPSGLPPDRWRAMLAEVIRRARRRERGGQRTRRQRAGAIRQMVEEFRAQRACSTKPYNG